MHCDRLDEAMQRYLDDIRLASNPARAHLNRGNILLLKDDFQGALDAFRTAIKHKPDYAGAYYNIGNALLGNKQVSEAVASYCRALEIQPDYAEAHCVLGIALRERGHIDGAKSCFRRAIEIDHDLAEARYHPNINGRYVILPSVSYPRWQGESLAGKSLMVWPEQGFGDEIQFARYISLLKTRGVSRITLVYKSPKALLGTLEGVDAVIPQSEAASLPYHDYWAFSMSLPLHFATTVDTIPAKLPYLSVLPERLE